VSLPAPWNAGSNPHCRRCHETCAPSPGRSDPRGLRPWPGWQPGAKLDLSKSYMQVQFENGQVRILRVACASGQHCPESEHPRDPAVVVIMSGPKRGDVQWSPTPADGPLEQVRIELKSKPVSQVRPQLRLVAHALALACSGELQFAGERAEARSSTLKRAPLSPPTPVTPAPPAPCAPASRGGTVSARTERRNPEFRDGPWPRPYSRT
jgi:hypothetical protein